MRLIAPALFVAALFIMPLAPAEVTAPNPAAAAVALYGAEDARLIVTTDGAFAAAFPVVVLYQVVEGDGYPGETHNMAWDGSIAYDVTRDFNALLANTGVPVLTTELAVRYSKAYAERGNGEIHLSRGVLVPDDASAVGVPVSAPSAVAVSGGFDATLSTWTREGTVSDWTIRFRAGALSSADWVVRAVGTGPATFDEARSGLVPGARLTNTYTGGHLARAYFSTPGGGETQALLPEGAGGIPPEGGIERIYTNYDGSTWRLNYSIFSAAYPPDTAELDLIDTIGQEAVLVYGKMVTSGSIAPCNLVNPAPNMGFIAAGGCEHPLKVAPLWLSIARPHFDGIEISTRVKPVMNALGYYLDPVNHTDRAVIRMVLAHEYGHVMHQNLGVRSAISAVSESFANAVEVLVAPEVADHPTSRWYGIPSSSHLGMGINYWLMRPDTPLCPSTALVSVPNPRTSSSEHNMDYALMWTHMYRENGGNDILRAALARIGEYDVADQQNVANCPRDLPANLSHVLATAPGGHATFKALVADLAFRMYAHDFAFKSVGDAEPRQWNKHVVPVTKTPTVPNRNSLYVTSYGHEYALLGSTGTWDVSWLSPTPNDWSVQIMKIAHNGTKTATTLPSGSIVRVDASASAEVVIGIVRTTHTAGTIDLDTIKVQCITSCLAT